MLTNCQQSRNWSSSRRPRDSAKVPELHQRPLSVKIIGQKLQQIAVGCEKHNIDVVSIQEHRLTITDGNDINQVDMGLDGWRLAHTSSSHASHGVALLFRKRVAQVLLNVERKSDHIIAVHLQGNPSMCIISTYVPTEASKDKQAKDAFYDDLEALISSLPLLTVIIVSGDFNARIGKDSHDSSPQIFGGICTGGICRSKFQPHLTETKLPS